MRHHYMNDRKPEHGFELIVEDIMPDAIVHTYFHTEAATLQAIAFLPAAAEWKVNRLGAPPEVT